MKKLKLILVTVVIFLSTGCLLGSAGKGYLTKTCTLLESLDSITKYEEISVTHKDNNLTEILIKTNYSNANNKYILKNLNDSIISLKNSLINEDGIDIQIMVDNENELEIQTSLVYDKISEYVKGIYSIEEQYNLQIKNLEKQGYKCK